MTNVSTKRTSCRPLPTRRIWLWWARRKSHLIRMMTSNEFEGVYFLMIQPWHYFWNSQKINTLMQTKCLLFDQSTSQRFGKRFAILDSWIVLRAHRSKSNGCNNNFPCSHCAPLLAYFRLCSLPVAPTSSRHNIFHSLFKHSLHGIHVRYLLHLSTLFERNSPNFWCFIKKNQWNNNNWIQFQHIDFFFFLSAQHLTQSFRNLSWYFLEA